MVALSLISIILTAQKTLTRFQQLIFIFFIRKQEYIQSVIHLNYR